MKSVVLTLLASILLSLPLAEIGVRLFFSEHPYPKYSSYKFEGKHGLKEPNTQIIEAKSEFLPEIQYNFDSFGRRKTPIVENSQSAHLFFGCSYVFGDGLGEEETLPWLFSKYSKISTYNYAYSGFGPHFMLSQLIDYNFAEQLPKEIKKIDASFFSYGFHTERYLGAFDWIGRNRVNGPYFKMVNGQLVKKGTFSKNRPLITFGYWALFYSKLFRLAFKDFGDSKGLESQELLCAIVEESYQRLKLQLGERFGYFYFVISPFQDVDRYKPYYEGVRRCLNPQIKVLKVDQPKEYRDSPGHFQIHEKFDSHPNKYANEWFAQKLIELMP